MYYIDGARVMVPRHAEMGRDFRDNGRYRKQVQDALDACANHFDGHDWDGGRIIVFTHQLSSKVQVKQYVVPRDSHRAITYGRCKLHTAHSPQLSPFVYQREPVLTPELTIELVKTRAKGQLVTQLVRAYGGEFAPPLPWQASVSNYEGGKRAALEFWRQYAFVMHADVLALRGTTTRLPRWIRTDK